MNFDSSADNLIKAAKLRSDREVADASERKRQEDERVSKISQDHKDFESEILSIVNSLNSKGASAVCTEIPSKEEDVRRGAKTYQFLAEAHKLICEITFVRDPVKKLIFIKEGGSHPNKFVPESPKPINSVKGVNLANIINEALHRAWA